MRITHLVGLAVVLIALAFGPPAATAQDYTITLTPASGLPGTVVTIHPNQTYTDARCYANGQQLPGLSYTVPGNAQGPIAFYCEAGSGEFYVRSNDAFFTVTLPDSDGDGVPDQQDACPNQPFQSADGCPPPDQPAQSDDSDGDGIPDSQDACPFVSGRGDQFGGVTGADGCPVDSDGDGINDGLDHCPFAAGPATANGCPTGETGQPAAPPAPALPELPADGACYLATQGTTRVNVRAQPGLDASITGSMDPYRVYTASLRYNDGAITWYRLDDFDGWAAGSVTRHSDPCDSLFWGTPDGELDTGSIRLAEMDYGDTFSACPELVDSASILPNYIIGYIIDAADSCDAARILIETLMFDDLFTIFGPTGISYDTINTMLAECPARVPTIIDRLRSLYSISPDVFTTVAAAVEAQRCAVDIDAALPDGFLTSGDGMAFALQDRCGMSLEDSVRVADRLIDSGAPDWSTQARFGFCESAEALALTGPIDAEKRAFLALLEETCNFEPMPLGILLLNAAQENMYSLDQLMDDIRRDGAAFCANPFAYIEERNFSPGVAATDPYWVPPQLQDCPDVANRLREYADPETGSGISFGDLAGILRNSSDPCAAGRTFLRTGQAPPPPADFTAPECVSEEDGRYSVVFEGTDDPDAWPESRRSVTVNDDSTWGGMLMALELLNWHGCEVEAPVSQFRHGLETRSCYYVSYWFQPQYPAELNPRGMFVEVNIWSWHGPYAQMMHTGGPIREYFTGNDPFHVTRYVWMRDVDVSAREAFTISYSHNYEDLLDVRMVRQYGIPVGVINEVREEFCRSDRTPVPRRASFTPPDDDSGATDDGEIGHADDSVATAAESLEEDPGEPEPVSLDFLGAIDIAMIIHFDTGSGDGDGSGGGSAGSEDDPGTGEGPSLSAEEAFSEPEMMELAPPAADDLPEGVSPDMLPGDGDAVPEPLPGPDAEPAFDLPTDPEALDALVDAPPALRGARGIFQATVNGQRELYVLAGHGDPVALTGEFGGDALLPALAPAGNRVAFAGEDDAGNRALFLLEVPGLDDVLRALSNTPDAAFDARLVALDTGPYTVLPYSPAWLPGGEALLVTLAGDDGVPGIYRLGLDDASMQLVVANAVDPTIDSRGRIVAFVREVDGVANIYSAALENPTARPVTGETAAPGCAAPAFGADPFALYFMCGEALYRYDVTGIAAVVPSGVTDFTPGPSAGLVTYSDGEGFYLLNEADGTTGPFAFTAGTLQAVSWAR